MKGPLVLLVDDSPSGRRLATAHLCAAGYSVETAANAVEALDKALRLKVQAIVSDVVMDEADGFKLCQQLRSNAAFADVPVVLVTSHINGATERRLAREVGASDLVLRTPDFSAELLALQASFLKPPPSKSMSDAELDADHLKANAHQLVALADRARTAEQRYRALFECSTDALVIIDRDGKLLEANPRAGALLDADPASLVGKTIHAFAPEGRKDSNAAVYAEALASPGQPRVAPVLRPDGRTIMIEFSNTVVELDGEQVTLCSGRDVTERIRATEALAASEERYRSVFERIPDVIWRCDPAGTLDFVTPNIERLSGFTDTELQGPLGLKFSFIHPEDAGRMATAWKKLVDTGEHFDLEYRRQSKDGQFVWVRNRSYAVTERNGVRLFEGMMTDITEKRQMEDALRQSQKMEALGQLTGSITHDFNNLIATVMLNTEFLIDSADLGDEARGVATEIKQSAVRAARLTRQLLAFSRSQPLDPQPVDLNATVAEMEKMLTRLTGAGIDWTFAPGPDAGRVRADTGQLEQVVMNLVVNARDAMPQGGCLTVATARLGIDRDEAARLAIPPGTYACVTVSDTGTGIDEATRLRMFEPFFTTKPVGKGTGLGLSTCYAIAKQSGGCIDVQSELGKGSTFRLLLPQLD